MKSARRHESKSPRYYVGRESREAHRHVEEYCLAVAVGEGKRDLASDAHALGVPDHTGSEPLDDLWLHCGYIVVTMWSQCGYGLGASRRPSRWRRGAEINSLSFN